MLLSSHDWAVMLPGYERYPKCFKQVIPFLFASLVFHENFLRAELDSLHPIFSTIAFTHGYIARFRDKVHIGYGSCDSCNVTCTGVPSAIAISNRLCSIEKNMKADMEKFQAEVQAQLFAIPIAVKDLLLENFDVSGVQPMTKDDLMRTINSCVSKLHEQIETLSQKIDRPDASRRQLLSERCVEVNNSTCQVGATVGRVWHWGGRFHPVPETFELPHCNVKSMWYLWHKGNPVQDIGPYRNILHYDLKDKKYKPYLSRIKYIMKMLDDEARTKVTGDFSMFSMPELISICDHAFASLLTRLYGDRSRHRVGDICVGTLYNRTCELKLRQTSE